MESKSASKSSISDHQPMTFHIPAAETLPEDIIEEILLKLPVRSLLKFTCVSKSWRSLISSNYFIEAHLKISSQDTNLTRHKIIATIQHPGFSLRLKQCSLPSFFSGLVYNVVDVDYPVSSTDITARVVGSCNGLVCFVVDRKHIYLFNPSTRKYKKLPDADSNMTKTLFAKYGFGFDESNKDYKVLAAYYGFRDGVGPIGTLKMKIYSWRTDSWKKIEGFENDLQYGALQFVNGNLHWRERTHIEPEPNSGWYIASFNLGSEICGKVAPPDSVSGCRWTSLGVIGGCLSVLDTCPETSLDVWVMKEYGVSESWVRMVSIPHHRLPILGSWFALVCIGPKGEVLFCFGSYFLIYSPSDDRLWSPEMKDFGKYFEVIVYCESLVPLL